MANNFDFVPERRKTESMKWNLYDEDVLPMWVADTDFRSPEPVIRALHDRVEHGIFGYPKDNKNLREAIIAWAAEHYSWNIQPDWIQFLPGVVVGFNLVARALAAPDGVLFHTPAYPPFLSVASHTGALEQTVDLPRQKDGTYAIDFDAFEAAFTPQTKMFLLCNPQNPTGRVFQRSELERLAEICIKKGVWICADEIHCDLIYSGNHHVPIASLSPEIAERTVTLLAPSKTFNIAGLQCSYAIVPNPELRKKLEEAKSGLVEGVNLLAQTAALAAYQEGGDWLKELLVYLEGNRDLLYTFVNNELPGISMGKPQGTYLSWLDCRQSKIQGNPSTFFVEKARVGLNDGERFGKSGKGFVRLNYGCPRSQLVEGLERMQKALKAL